MSKTNGIMIYLHKIHKQQQIVYLMKKTIQINKNGVLKMNPIWVSLNNEKYKLHFSNTIHLTSNQQDNTIRIRDWSFIYSKEIVLNDDDSTNLINIRINSLEKSLRLGMMMLALLIILYIMLPWRFFPTYVLYYVLWGGIALYTTLSLWFARKQYVEIID